MTASAAKTWRVPLSDVRLSPTEIEAVVRVLESGWLSQGPVTERFENAFAHYVGARYAIAVASGTAALHLAYRAAGLGPGDEVLCPSITFVATVSAAVACGATPVFFEIEDVTLPVPALRDIEQKITDRTRCLTVVDYGGYSWDIEPVCKLARSAGLIVVEDAAHAIGAVRNGRSYGTFGDIGCFSFFSNKNMTTGEGGMVVTDDEGFAAKVRLLRSHGMTRTTWERHRGGLPIYDVVEFGYNYRIDEIRAALGIAQLRFLNQWNQKRRELVSRYRERLSRLPGITLTFDPPFDGSACHLMPILLPDSCDRGKFVAKLHELGIQTSYHYPPVHTLSAYRRRWSHSLPVSEEFGDREVTLPLHPHMEFDEVDLVCEAVEEALEQS